MNHGQKSNDGKHDDNAALSDFLASLVDYTPTILDELVEHYLATSGFQCPDVGLVRLVAVATLKFVAEVASDALQHCKARQTAVVKDKREKQQKDKRLIVTMEALPKALRESGFPRMKVHPRSPGQSIYTMNKQTKFIWFCWMV